MKRITPMTIIIAEIFLAVIQIVIGLILNNTLSIISYAFAFVLLIAAIFKCIKSNCRLL
jgi:hypothetical protein